ncbi:MAG: GHMP family kinase ATP-binding protein [Actinomycetota bacterium]
MSIVVGRAPGRVSLMGGGTDLPEYYERHGGFVVSMAVSLYAYGQASPRASDLELVSLDHAHREVITPAHFARRMRPPILAEEFLTYQKAVAWHFGIERGRLAAASEIPAGVGLASSAAVCVSLVMAASRFIGEDMDRTAIAETACRIEMKILGRSCGKQDQYAAAFGGVNSIEFNKDGSVNVEPLTLAPGTIAALQSRMMLFTNGARRNAQSVLAEQARRSIADPETVGALHQLKDMAYAAKDLLLAGEADAVGQLLHQAWEAKRHLNSQTHTPEIDRVYALAREAGAIGGKLTGAGLVGTMLLYCPPDSQNEVRRALASQGWRERKVSIDWGGASLCANIGGPLVLT